MARSQVFSITPEAALAAAQQIGLLTAHHCDIHNLNDTQSAVSDRTPLLIDGLGKASFNTLGYDVWDPETSRIRPQNSSQAYDGRLIFKAKPTVGNSVLTIQVDRSPDGSNTPDLPYNKTITLVTLEPTPIVESFIFYANPAFLENGGRIWISCTEEVAISDVSLYLFLKGGHL